MQRFGQSVGAVKAEIDRTAHATTALTASMARMGHFAAGFLGAREFAQTADAVTEIDARLRIFEGSSEKAASAFQGIFKIAQEGRAPLEGVADLYTKFARNADDLGLSQERILGLTRTITQAMATTGGASASAEAAIMQFGQALSAGVLRGEELNSIMEQAPALADAIAKGLGRTTGELKAMGEQGLITVPEIISALERMAPVIEQQFAQMPITIAAALTQIRNEFMLFVRDSSAVQGGVQATVGALGLLMRYFDEGVAVAGLLAAVMAGRVVGSMLAAAAATLEQAKAAQAARLAAADSAALAARRAQAEQQAALIAQSASRAKVAAVAVEVAADRERVASAGLAAEQEIAARQAQFVAVANIVRQEIALEKARLAAQINDVGRAARLRELAALSQQLQAAERGAAAQTAALTAQRVANEQAMAQAATAGSARVIAARNAETAATEAAAAATLQLRGAQASAAATAGAAAAGAGLFRGAIAALGGPVGALITLLSVGGVAAWMAFGDSAEESGKKVLKAADAAAEARKRIAELDREGQFGTGELGQQRERLAAAQKELDAYERMANLTAQGKARRDQLRRDVADIEALVQRLEQHQAKVNDIQSQVGADWRRFMENTNFATKAEQDLEKFNELSRAYVAAIAAIAKARPGVDPLNTQEGIQALDRYKGKLGELQGEMQKTAIAAETRLRDALVDAMRDGQSEAQKLKGEIADLLAQAANIRSGVAGAGAKAQERRDRGLTDDERESVNRRRANDALSEAMRYSTYSQNAQIDGRAEKAQEYARRAADLIRQASQAADQLKDDAAAARIFDQIAEAEASALESQAAAKKQQLADIEAATVAQAQALTDLEARVAALKGEAATVQVKAETEVAQSALEGVKAAVDAIPDRKVIQIEWSTKGSPPTGTGEDTEKGFAWGGWTGPGSKYKVAGVVHAEEFVNRREVVRQPGARSFLELFNQMGMRALDVWRNGFAGGGFVQALSAPVLSSGLSGDSRAMLANGAGPQPLVGSRWVLPGGQEFPVLTTQDVHAEINRYLRISTLARGSRR